MRHDDNYGGVYYDPRPETLKARAELDRILKHTKFTWRTKGLWAYFRRNRTADKARRARKNKAREVYTLNLELNGALQHRLVPPKCWVCGGAMRCLGSNRQRLNRFKKSIRPSTLAHWDHAIELIDIALEHKDGKPAKETGY